jgi:ATP-dependent Lon protease
VILPRKNLQDLEEIPKDLKRRITFLPVDHMDQVLEAALEAAPGRRRGRASRPRVTPSPVAAAKLR